MNYIILIYMEELNFDNFDKQKLSPLYLKKVAFIFNALEKGWTIHKQNDSYIFNKKHENKKEIFLDDYLNKFIQENCVLKGEFLDKKK